MRIVSMVPSWTETLIEAGGDVVGRTRFCIHPSQKVRRVQAIGGTKSWETEKLRSLNPDLIILDREENTVEMGGWKENPMHVTHAQNVQGMPMEFEALAQATGLESIKGYSDRMQVALAKAKSATRPVADLPGVIRWIRKPERPIETVIYMIWKNPWMAATRATYIGSMLGLFLPPHLLFGSEEKYPKITLGNFNEETTLLLFSSEPFPFGKQLSVINELAFPSALVDGESWSWFGVRSLRFLEGELPL